MNRRKLLSLIGLGAVAAPFVAKVVVGETNTTNVIHNVPHAPAWRPLVGQIGIRQQSGEFSCAVWDGFEWLPATEENLRRVGQRLGITV